MTFARICNQPFDVPKAEGRVKSFASRGGRHVAQLYVARHVKNYCSQ
jgi:hypothetical protein